MRRFWLAALLAASPAWAEVTVTEAWARGTVPAQRATGIYLKITSTKEARVLSASTPAAKAAEIHEMSMKDGVMQMREIGALALPAGKTVELRPGGLHLMLMGLAKPLRAGESVPLKLEVEESGKRRTIEVKVEVRPLDAAPPRH